MPPKRRTVKIPKVTTIEKAREVLRDLLPDRAELTVIAYMSDRRAGGSRSSYTSYTAQVRLDGETYEERTEADGHSPDLLVRQFVRIVLPAINARTLEYHERTLVAKRIGGPTVRRLEHHPSAPIGGLFDGRRGDDDRED